MNLSAVILAGGESRRMGQDKAWLRVDGQPLIVRAVARARELGIQEVYISGRADADYSSLGCPVLLDRQPGLGPLGGIDRGLEACVSPLLLVLAVDLPNMSPAFLCQLRAACAPSTGAVPSLNGHLEPLAAIYPKACHSVVQGCLLKSRYAARGFAEQCVRQGFVKTYSVAAQDAGLFANWNSDSDLNGLRPVV